MKYSELPKIYKFFIDEDGIYNVYQNDEYESFEVDDDKSYYAVEDELELEFRNAIDTVGLEGPDDFAMRLYFDANKPYSKSTQVELQLRGSFQFCVYGCAKYGKKAYSTLAKAISKFKYDGFTVDELYQPEDTPGIAFNGIYQTDDMIYICGKFEFTPYRIDVDIPKTKKFLVAITPYDANYVGYQMKINAPADSTEDDLHDIIVSQYEDKILKLVDWKDIQFRDYEDDYFECIVSITFDGMPYKIYMDNDTSKNLRLNDNTSARMCAWKQLLEDLEVEDISFLL